MRRARPCATSGERGLQTPFRTAELAPRQGKEVKSQGETARAPKSLGYSFFPSPSRPRAGGLPLFHVGAEAQQGVFGRDQFTAGLVELLLLALHEAAVGGDGLVDTSGGLVELQMDLTGEGVSQLGSKLGDPALEV